MKVECGVLRIEPGVPSGFGCLTQEHYFFFLPVAKPVSVIRALPRLGPLIEHEEHSALRLPAGSRLERHPWAAAGTEPAAEENPVGRAWSLVFANKATG